MSRARAAQPWTVLLGVSMATQTSEPRTFEVMITCPSLAQSETVIVQAANAGEAQPAAIVVTTLQLTGQEIAFQVRELPRVS